MTRPRPVLPKVSMAKYSPSSILVVSRSEPCCLTMGTVLPPWMQYGAMECPFRFVIDFTLMNHRNGSCRTYRKLTLMRFAGDLHLIAFHDLLNGISNVAHSHVDTCFLITYQMREVSRASVKRELTRTPVFVASLTASKRRSHVGSKFMVNAESTMRPFTWTPKSTFITSPF